MTSRFKAVCDEHKEYCSIFVVHWGSSKIAWPPGSEKEADDWLSAHWTCKLRLVRDDNEDYPEGYVDKTPP